MEINTKKAIEYILNQLYFSEFQIIDRLNQHPNGLNFYDWLFEKKLISQDGHKAMKNKCAKEFEED